MRPVQRVAIALFGQQVRGDAALGNPRREPARRRLALQPRDALTAIGQQFALLLLRAVGLPEGIAVAVAHQFVAAREHGLQQFRAMVQQRRVDQSGRGQAELVEQFEAAPGADPVAVFTPAVVQHIGLRRSRTDAGTEPFAEGKVLEVEAEVDRQPMAAGPAEVRALRDRAVAKAAAVGKGLEAVHGMNPCKGRGCAQSVASPARTSSHSALSFHTSICTIFPCLNT